MRARARWMVAAALTAAVPESLASQQAPTGLSLEEAVRRATQQSEEVRLARSQVALARAQVTGARAQALPQVSASLGYTKTLASAFDTGGGGFQLPDSLRFEPDPTAPLEQRVSYLEDRTPLAGLAGIGGLFSDLPFGQENAYTASLSGSQLLYSGGRVGAAMNIARNYRRSAELGLAEQLAEIELQVRTAYYQALFAGRMEEISGEALAQAERFLEQERLRLKAGRASELEVMRAEVSRDNLRPQQVEARNAAELAMLNLKRLVDLPLGEPVALTTELVAPTSEELRAAELSPEVRVAQRATLQAAQEQVEIRRQQVRVAQGAFLPNVALQMNYGRQLFPTDPFQFEGDWRTDWTVGLNVSVPLFTGLRRTAELEQAQVELEQSRLQLSQLRESVQLQYEQARGERERALAAIEARGRTADVAQRVYDLTVLRYEQGLATQLEVNDARLSLLQARTNQAQAVTDFYIADAGLTRSLVGPSADGLPSRFGIPVARR